MYILVEMYNKQAKDACQSESEEDIATEEYERHEHEEHEHEQQTH